MSIIKENVCYVNQIEFIWITKSILDLSYFYHEIPIILCHFVCWAKIKNKETLFN